MSTFVWLSRHPLSDAQKEALVQDGYDDIQEWGDIEAFSGAKGVAMDLMGTNAGNVTVGVVHAFLSAYLLGSGFTVAVSENINRAAEGEKPRFEFSKWYYLSA